MTVQEQVDIWKQEIASKLTTYKLRKMIFEEIGKNATHG